MDEVAIDFELNSFELNATPVNWDTLHTDVVGIIFGKLTNMKDKSNLMLVSRRFNRLGLRYWPERIRLINDGQVYARKKRKFIHSYNCYDHLSRWKMCYVILFVAIVCVLIFPCVMLSGIFLGKTATYATISCDGISPNSNYVIKYSIGLGCRASGSLDNCYQPVFESRHGYAAIIATKKEAQRSWFCDFDDVEKVRIWMDQSLVRNNYSFSEGGCITRHIDKPSIMFSDVNASLIDDREQNIIMLNATSVAEYRLVEYVAIGFLALLGLVILLAISLVILFIRIKAKVKSRENKDFLEEVMIEEDYYSVVDGI